MTAAAFGLSSQYSRFLHKPVEAKGSSGNVTGEGKLMRQSGVSCLSPARMVFGVHNQDVIGYSVNLPHRQDGILQVVEQPEKERDIEAAHLVGIQVVDADVSELNAVTDVQSRFDERGLLYVSIHNVHAEDVFSPPFVSFHRETAAVAAEIQYPQPFQGAAALFEQRWESVADQGFYPCVVLLS